jgi:GT2 family glycosyltransferase
MTGHRLAPRRWGHLAGRALHYLRQDGLLALLRRALAIAGPELAPTLFGYGLWRRVYQTPRRSDLRAMRRHMASFARRPTFRVVALRPPTAQLLASLEAQLYCRWQLIEGLQTLPPADNDDYLVLLDGDEILAPHALYMAAAALECDPGLDGLYADEDRLDQRDRHRAPLFKPDWSPNLLLGWDYIGGFVVLRQSLLTSVDKDAERPSAASRYALLLSLAAGPKTPRIAHLPWILVHRRDEGDPGPQTAETMVLAATQHCRRLGLSAQVLPLPGRAGLRRVRLALPNPAPRVSVIIPTRDRVELLAQCVDGLLDATDYPDLEIIIVDNGSRAAETRAYLDKVAGLGVKVLRDDSPFNYAALNNRAAAQASGQVLLLLNNDIKVIHGDWLTEMVGHALRADVGAVGAKLYFPDDTIQHAGVVIGLGGVAGHLHHGVARADSRAELHLLREVSAVTAACLATRAEVFRAVGGFDADRLAVAFNDVDLCLKIRRLGLKILWTPFAELYHFESASRGSDLAPDKIERFRTEHRAMQALWGATLADDPFYSPNRTQDGCDGGLAFPPRLVKPWAR